MLKKYPHDLKIPNSLILKEKRRAEMSSPSGLDGEQSLPNNTTLECSAATNSRRRHFDPFTGYGTNTAAM